MKRALKKVLPLTLSALLLASPAIGEEDGTGGDADSGDDGARNLIETRGGSKGCTPYSTKRIGNLVIDENYRIGPDLTRKVTKIMQDKFGVSKMGSTRSGSIAEGTWYIETPEYRSVAIFMHDNHFLVQTRFKDGRKHNTLLKYPCGGEK